MLEREAGFAHCMSMIAVEIPTHGGDMHMANFIQAILFLVAVMLVFLVILTDRSAQRVALKRVAPIPARKLTK